MHFASLIGGVGVLLATAAAAAPGDALLVTGNSVNVRAGPSTEAGILARVNLDEPATELRRLGDWVEVELPDRDVLGWIHGSLLAPAPASVPAQDRPPSQQVDTAPAGVATQGDAPPRAEVASRAEPASEPVAISPPAAAPAATSTPPVTTAAVEPIAGPHQASASASSSALEQFRSEVELFNDRALAAAGVNLFTGVEPLGAEGVQVITTDAWAIMSTPGQQSYLNALYGRWQAAKGGGGDLRLQIIDSSGALMAERSGP